MQTASAIDLFAGRRILPLWWPAGVAYAADFTNHRYMKSGRACAPGDAFSVARNTSRLARDSNGHWHGFAPDIPARTDIGLSVSNAAANGVRNSAMAGAEAGLPGSLPAHWAFFGGNGIEGHEIIGTGTASGLPYIDLRIAGLTIAASGVALAFETHGVFGAGQGDDVTFSCHFALAGGAVEGFDIIRTRIIEHRADGSVAHTHYPPPIRDDLTPEIGRFTMTREVVNAETASVVADIETTFASGQALDMTLRIAAPQLELGTTASAPILSSGIVGMRDADRLMLHLPPGSHDLEIAFADAAPQIIAGAEGDLVLGRNDLDGGQIVSAIAVAA